MTIFFSILLSLALLAGIVFLLHRYQQEQASSNADRQSPLPPLDPGSTDDLQEETAAPSPAPVQPVTTTAQDWSRQCTELKARHAYADALALCIAHYPQRKAFDQGCKVLRAQLRKDSSLDDSGRKALLEQLYLTACQDSFLHDRSEGMKALSATRLQHLPESAWKNLEMPYSEIGYTELGLLVKSDYSQLESYWGTPHHHRSAKAYHLARWQELLTTYGG